MTLLFKCALLQKQIPHCAHLQGELFYILQSNSSTSVFTLHIFIPIENLTYIVINLQKVGRLLVHLVPLSDFGGLKTYRLRD